MRRLLILAVALVLTASGEGGGSSSTPTVEDTKFKQTWTTAYATTTCEQWNTKMDNHQQWVAAADMLTGAWKHDGVEDLPPDAKITEFQNGITRACVIPSETLIDLAAGLYITDRALFSPKAT